MVVLRSGGKMAGASGPGQVAELADDGSQPDHPDGESARALVVVPQTLHVSGRKRLRVPCHGLFISLESRCFSARRMGPLGALCQKESCPVPLQCSPPSCPPLASHAFVLCVCTTLVSKCSVVQCSAGF